MMNNICILIPVFNEAKNIRQVIEGAAPTGLDIIVINDGSTDGSGAIAREAGAYVITTPQRSGKGAALQLGFEYALSKDYVGVIIMDGDGQHAPEDLPGFLETAAKDPDCVIVGNRLHDPSKMPFVRLITNRVMSWIISLACRQSIPDTQCGYRYLGMKVLREIKFATKAYEIETEILMKSAKKGISVYNVPVQTIYREEESHIRPVHDTINFIKYYVRELFSSK